MKAVLVINGPNLNMLGQREPDIYGNLTLDNLQKVLEDKAAELKLKIKFMQSNHEGEIIDAIHLAKEKYDCILLNAAAYSHYSIAIRDAIAAVDIPTIEVHMTNVFTREEFRAQSIIAPACKGFVCGFGIDSYILALNYIGQCR